MISRNQQCICKIKIESHRNHQIYKEINSMLYERNVTFDFYVLLKIWELSILKSSDAFLKKKNRKQTKTVKVSQCAKNWLTNSQELSIVAEPVLCVACAISDMAELIRIKTFTEMSYKDCQKFWALSFHCLNQMTFIIILIQSIIGSCKYPHHVLYIFYYVAY